jgi:metal-responsive CopG/Arc/MetJ family transcriptional regulator
MPPIARTKLMKTIQMTIDEQLLEEVDSAVNELQINRSAFIRDALHLALQQLHIHKLEAQQARGYHRQPATATEFAEWEPEQVWGEL